MATKLHGLLNLTKISALLKQNPALKYKNSKGEDCIWVDVLEKKTADMYGSTHTITFYDKATGTVYLADLKPQEFGQSGPAVPNSPKPSVSISSGPVRGAAPAGNDLPADNPDDGDFPF